MRVLFVPTPAVGHLFPLVPLAWALRSAGHEVLVGSSGGALNLVKRAGLPAVDVAPGIDWKALNARKRQQEPEQARKPVHEQIFDARLLADRFVRLSDQLTDGVVAAAEWWRPHLIIQSKLQGAGLVAGGKFGIPVVDHGTGLARTPGLPGLLREHLAPAFDRHGVAALPDRLGAIDVAPPSMADAQPEGWPVRHVPYNAGAVLPAWLAEPPRRPRIVVTLGTVSPKTHGVGPVHRLLEFAGAVDAEFVLALGDIDVEQFGPLPSNVRLAGWVPLHALLPGCRAVIHHGGSGTTLAALVHGVPQLVLPNNADRFINAAAVRRRGGGLEHEEPDLSAGLVERLLHDEKLHEAAGQVRDEITTLPTPADLVETLADFTTGRPPAPPPPWTSTV